MLSKTKADICSHQDHMENCPLFRWAKVAPGGCAPVPSIGIGRCQAEARRYSGAERGRRWRMAPRESQMPRAIHSASEKCPGTRGRLHQEKQQGDGNPHPGHDPHRWSLLHDPERQARGEPSHGRRHRTHFRDGNEERITPEEDPPALPAVIPRMATLGVRNFS